MPNLRDIEKRITSTEGTKQITRTMEMVAAAKIRRAQERIDATAPYSEAISEVLSNVAANAGTIIHPLLETHKELKRIILVVVVSDRGLAGGFNGNILRMAEKFIAEKEAEGIKVDLILSGKRAVGYFEHRGADPIVSFSDISDKPTFAMAKEIATRVITDYSNDEADEVVLMYNWAKNVAEQVPTQMQILPISTDFAERKEDDGDTKVLEAQYLFEPSAHEVLKKLLPTYVEMTIFRALLDSAAAEQGARRKAMKSATDNASELIQVLTRSYNRARQAAITTEIAEIVGGAAALEG